MELHIIVNSLRKRLCEYRTEKEGKKSISTHINAIDIVLALTDLGLTDQRPIQENERNWFSAGLYLSYIFDGSEWEDIVSSFEIIVQEVERLNYFQK